MSDASAFIGVDWGTSNARFLLVDQNGRVVEQRGGPDIGQIDGASAIEEICFDTIADWIAYNPELPVIMAAWSAPILAGIWLDMQKPQPR
jgi:2-dehydro-3-deoxygalactonokinase